MNKINFQNGSLVSKAKVTVDGTVYEVEPAEYEGTTPLNAENLNQIQTNAENAINTVQSNLNTTNLNIENSTTYSATEKVIGTFKDGSPIYRKMFEISIPTANEEQLIAHNLQNVDKIWLGNPSFLKSEGNCIPVNHYRDSGAYLWCLVNEYNIRIKTGASGWTNKTIYITLEYTKTTN